MRLISLLLIGFLNIAVPAFAADLAAASSQDLLALYKQLRSIQGTDKAAIAENVIFKRDAANFTFLTGRIAFAAPIGGRVLAAKFSGEGKFEIEPPSAIDQRQLARFAKSPKLEDTFSEAVFYFTDDTYEEMTKLMKVRDVPGADRGIFASSQKNFSENFNTWLDSVRKRNPAIRNIAARMLADLTDNSSKGFFLAHFKGSKSGELLFHISWNRDMLVMPAVSKGEEIILLRLNPGQYYEWWSGFHLSSEYKQSPHPDHRTLHVRCPEAQIDLNVSKDNKLEATAQMEFVVSGDSARVLPFNIENVLRIISIEDGTGKPLSFIQEDRKLDNDPWVILAEPAKAGETYKIKISYKEDSTYETRLINDQGGGLYNVTSWNTWFPSFGTHDDRTQYEVRARSPKKFKFVTSGTPVASTKEKDELVSTWKSEIPLRGLGFNYGDFVESIQNVPEMKLTAYSGRELPNRLQGIENGFNVGGIMAGGRTDVQLMKGGLTTANTVKHAADMGIQAFKLFEFLLGPLSFKSMSIVAGAGSSGFPNLISLPYEAFLDSTTQNRLGFLQAAESREYYKTVAVNELAHQWLGHLVGPKTYHDQWLYEGGADFASSMYLRQFEPKDLNEFRDIRRKWLLSKNSSGYRPVDAGPMWLNSQLNEWEQTGNAGFVIRYKGGYIFEMLRVLMYDTNLKNPDGRFIAMMHEFTSTYAGQNASTEDFRRIVEKNAGRSMEWFFNEWVYGSATPKYDFSYQIADAGGGQSEVTMTLVQSEVPDTFKMQLPLYAVINGEPRFLTLIGITGTTPLKTSVKLPMRPEKVLLDPERSILAEIHQ
jgi:hypothetical protein